MTTYTDGTYTQTLPYRQWQARRTVQMCFGYIVHYSPHEHERDGSRVSKAEPSSPFLH
jgi:hypothetical protein